jgi:AcrR family transcriptional regulator
MLAPDTAQARDRLIDAAEAVIVRDGVANLTLDAVAREAGVSKGGLLYHFPSKSALTMAIVERLATRCEANQARALQAEPASPGAFTRAYLHARLESAIGPRCTRRCSPPRVRTRATSSRFASAPSSGSDGSNRTASTR